jgi:hypothetical protein
VTRDPDRIAETLALLTRAWALFPDWRLGQLLVNAVDVAAGERGGDPFYAEDDEVAEGLRRLIAERDA